LSIIQCDETALLAHAALDHIAVERSFQPLIGYRDDIEASVEQDGGRGSTEIVVELELHAGLVTGMSTYRSRLLSAA
jgi:hypothetical protein